MFMSSLGRLLLVAAALCMCSFTARAECRQAETASVMVDIPREAISIPSNAKAGDVLYDRIVPFQIVFGQAPLHLQCSGPTPNYLFLFNDCTSKICMTENASMGITVDLDLPNYEPGWQRYRLPDGDLSEPINVKARVRVHALRDSRGLNSGTVFYYGRGPTAISAWPPISSRGATGWYFRTNGLYAVRTTCEMTAPDVVTLPTVASKELTGIGSTAKPKDFNITLNCSGERQVSDIGVAFSPAYRHPSGAPGVIATDIGNGNANNVAFQIINKTTQRPIEFGQLERGTRMVNGTAQYPFTVQYYQTGATIAPGPVRGRVVVRVQMQ
ncbi:MULTISPECIES: fimbrial protein [unclassified Herbaspirillum]|uniref:fimbrial protein n=1 Tax=unclassified Herbaspirillum TaxID=2624150 RepID=UPI0011541508|nr:MULTISPECIES: fimbrial protein [unclassified Herbaspirillum]MBB5392711.1 type 1 fimbria pilin [Herbaspirillum sp. SJZ102]TQK06346.1 type 1 fimbria pilin [Herbaspirillum sp. SJZ130]TQK12176.1 type 1 fimbria pilin [Herbaspirillum sp. SJZ106]